MTTKTAKKDQLKTDNKSKEDFKKLLEEGDFVKVPKVGDLVKGNLITITKSEAMVDIDGLATGIVRGREFFDEASQYKGLKPGDSVEATVLELENENGEMELSFRFATHQKAWEELKKHLESGEVVKIKVVDANKGGLMIKLDAVAGFLPVSQLSTEHYPRVPGGDKNKILEKLKSYIGLTFDVKVITAVEDEDKLIVSERSVWEEEQKDVIAQFKIGDGVETKITAVTDFGVFVEFGEKLEGLVHISELAWQRIDDPRDFFKVGEKLKAEIISIDGSKIFLSFKKLKTDPWHDVDKRYKVGDTVKGKVLKANPFGLFVELDKDIHGLAHISELSNQPVANPQDIAKSGDVINFKILSIEPNNHRLGLSLKALGNKAPKKSSTDKESKEDKDSSKKEEKEAKPKSSKKEEKATTKTTSSKASKEKTEPTKKQEKSADKEKEKSKKSK